MRSLKKRGGGCAGGGQTMDIDEAEMEDGPFRDDDEDENGPE